MFDLMKAVYDRWVAANLHTTIAELYPAGEGSKSGQNRTGAPVETTMPRAEYSVFTPAATIKTRGSRTAQAVAVFHVWDRKSDAQTASDRVASHVQSIRSKYLNADAVGMSMQNGDILEVDDGGSACAKVDDDVWMGTQTIIIRHTIANGAPA